MTPANDNRPPEFDARIVEYLPGLYSLAGKYTRNQEQRHDLVVDTIMDALSRWQSFREDGGFWNWLSWCMRGVASNYSKMSLTTKGQAKHVSFEEIQPILVARPTQHEHAYLAEILAKLGKIRNGDLLLRRAMGDGDGDIAGEFGVTSAAINARVKASRNKLREVRQHDHAR